MWRTLRCGAMLSVGRGVSVGPTTTIPTAAAVPAFGRRRRRRVVGHAADTGAVTPEMDDDAKSICFERYDFVQKPAHMQHWTEFLQELKRVEFRWSLLPVAGGVYTLKVFDHREPGDGELCQLRGNGNQCTPIAEVFESCGSLTQGVLAGPKDVHFVESGTTQVLRLEGHRSLPSGDWKDTPPILPTLEQFNCRGTTVDVSVVDLKTQVKTPLFNRISLQTLNYAFLTSLPPFFKRMDVGIRNREFVSAEQMHHFRFAWCFLRKESLMTPVELGELDTLLPTS